MEVAELDEDRPPLHWQLPLHPIQYYQPLIIKKAFIILCMIERRLTPELFQKVSPSPLPLLPQTKELTAISPSKS